MKNIFWLFLAVILASAPAWGRSVVSGGGTNQVNYSNLASVPATSLLGNPTGSTGNAVAIPLQQNSTLVGGNPVSGASAEYPFTEGAGNTAYDISGNGNNSTFSSTPPIWTTYGIAFNPTATSNNEYVSTPLTSWGTFIVNVCNPQLPANNSTGTGGSAYPVVLGTAGNGLLLLTTNSTANSAQLTLYPSIFSSLQGAFKTTSQAVVQGCATVSYVLGTSADHIYVNGNEIAYGIQGGSLSFVSEGTPYLIGGGANNNYFTGNINYAIFYPNPLNVSQIQKITSYVNAKMISRIGFPTYPQLSTFSAQQLICDGDSVTEALHGTGPWCNSTNVLTNSSYNFDIWAIPGYEAHYDIGNNIERFISSIAPASGRSICHIWLGSNDVTNSGWTAAQTWAALQQDGQAAKFYGCIPVIATMISRTGSGIDALKNQLNTLIRANWQSTFAAIDDLAAIPALGADGAYSNTACFYSDQIHLTGPGAGTCFQSLTGYGVVANQVAKVVNILDGATAQNPTVTASNAYTQAIADNFVFQTPTAAATDTLPDCTGLTGITRQITNGSSTYAITMQTTNSQTLTGNSTIAANATAKFQCLLISASAAGNYWLRTQ